MNNAVMLAERYGITDKCKALEHALLKIHGATSVEFELNGFLDNIHQVIVLVGYDFHQIRELPTFAREVALEAFQHDLKKSGDRIEDYGEHLYFVFDCGQSWLANQDNE